MAEHTTDDSDPAIQARRSPVRTLTLAVLAVVAITIPTVLIARVDANFGVPSAATKDGAAVVTVWRMLIVMATAVASLVVLLLAVALVGGARRQRASQTKGSVPLEVAYTVAPLALVAIIFGTSGWLGYRMTDATDGDALEIRADAFRWGWRFTYPNGHQVVGSSNGDEAVVVLPVGHTVAFDLHSEDVIHSFYIPSFVTKLDVIPGQERQLRVRTEEIGEYRGHCTEYCGLDHARMNFRVLVVAADDFDAWLATGAVPP